jgi:hypothetical protein
MNAPIRSRPAPHALALAALLAACSPAQDGAAPAFMPVADVQQLMASVVEPAAEVYWDAVGTIIDQSGVTEMRPDTPEEWQAVRNAAFVIAESGNLLLMEGRAVDEAAWTAMSIALRDIGRRALEAADAMDVQAVFDVGAEVYYACVNCHAAYSTELLRPNDDRAN